MVEVTARRRAPEMRLGRESALTFSGIVVNAGIAFVVTWLIARGLGAGATGAFFLLTSLFMISTSVIGLGSDTGLVRSLSRSRATDRMGELGPTVAIAMRPVILLGLILTAMLVVAADPIADRLVPGTDGASTLRLLALALVPATSTGILLAGSRGLGHIRTYTVVQNLVVPISRLALVAAAIAVLGTTWSVVWAWAIPLFLASAIAALALRRQLRAAAGAGAALPTAERDELARGFWSFSLPRGGAVILERGLDWADVLLVIALMGPSAGGVYGVVTRIVQAGNMLEAALRIVLGPRLSSAIAKEDLAGADALYRKVTQLLILGSWPFYLSVAVFADVLLGLFGSEFVPGAPALVVLATAMALKNTAGALQTVLLMAGRSTWQLRNKAIQLAVLLSLAGVLVPVWGLNGAAIAFAVGVAVDTLLAARQVHRLLGFSAPLRSIARAAVLPVLVVVGGSIAIRLLLPGAGALVQLTGLALALLVYGIAVRISFSKGLLSHDRHDA